MIQKSIFSAKFIRMLIVPLCLLANAALAQTTINTTVGSTGYDGTNAAGNGYGITFVINNTSAQDIILTDVGDWTISSDNGSTYSLYYSSTSLSGTPPTTFPATGWTLAASATVNSISSSTLAVNTVLTGMTFVIPANTMYRFSLVTSGYRRYSGTGSNNPTPDSFVTNGVALYVGDYQIGGQYVGYGATNNPRFFTGSISFIPAVACAGQPDAGIINASDTFGVCASTPLTIIDTGASLGTGLTYQWQMRDPSGTGTWTDITGATNTTLNLPAGITNATDFRMYAICTNSSLTDTSAPVTATINAPNLCYCTPTSQTPSINYITNVTTTGGAINFNQTSASSAYTDYTTTDTVSAAPTTNINFSVTPALGSSTLLTIWVDWNQDGIFNNTDEVAYTTSGNGNNGTPFTGTINVPTTALSGNTRMRVRSEWYNYGAPTDPCAQTYYGEAEDYIFNVIPLVACTGTPDAGTILGPDTLGVCPNTPFTLSDSGATYGSGITYQWQMRDPSGTGTWTDITGANNTLLNIAAGITNATDYRFYEVCSNSGMSDTSNIIAVSINSITQCYCDVSTGGNTTYYLSNVNVYGATGFNNTSTTSGAAYIDYSSTYSASQVQGQDVTFTLTGGPSGNTFGLGIWIDFNQNGIFDDPGENVYNSNTYLSTASGTFTIPLTATPGNTKMRVVAAYIPSNPTPCAPTTYTAYEDYSFNVIELVACSGTPDAGTILGPDTLGVCSGIPFTLSDSGASVGSGITYQWQQRAPSGTGTWTDITGANSFVLNVAAGVTSPTDYRFYEVCSNSGMSDTSNIIATTMNIPTQCYCTPSYNYGCDYDEDLNIVQLAGQSVTLDNSGSGCTTGGYADNTSMNHPNLVPGLTYTINIGTSYSSPQYMDTRAWIDYNGDGFFDATEEIANSNGAGLTAPSSAFSFTVPVTATTGSYRMRVRNVDGGGSSIDPCSMEYYGETEDYMVDIVPLVACSGTPDAGIILGGDTVGVCALNPFTISDSGATFGSGITYQWQMRDPSGTGTWTDITGATSTSLNIPSGISTATDYRFYVVCSNSSSADTSNVVTYTINPGIMCYCTPTYNYGCSGTDEISNVSLTGVSISINNSTTCSPNAYGDYTSLPAPDLVPGLSYDLSVSTDYGSPNYENVRAWIDYNDDGFFDSSEMIADAAVTAGDGIDASGTSTFNFSVPPAATSGDHRMRVRLAYSTVDIDPCTQYYYGETEDYNINVIALSPCSGTPEAGEIDTFSTFGVCASTPLTLVDTGFSIAANMTYQWQQRDPAGTGTWTDITGATNATLNLAMGITDPTDFRFYVVCNNSAAADTSAMVTATINPATACYCTPSNTMNTAYYVSNFTTTNAVANVNNSTGFSPNGFGDYTTTDTIQTYPGQTIDVSMSSLLNSTYIYGVWVDYNQDGQFDNTTELVTGSAGNYVSSPFTGSFTIPLTVTTGPTRLRIRNSYSGTLLPCGNNNYSEAEDYIINIVPLVACSGTPEAGAISSADTVGICAATPLTLTDTGYSIGSGLTYQWQQRDPSGTGTWADITGANTPTLSIPTGISSATDFRFYVVCSNSSSADTTSAVTFTINPATACYCTPTYTTGCAVGDDISAVVLNGETVNLNNTGSGCSTNGYGIYDTMAHPDLVSDSTYTISISTSYSYPTDENVRAWIDYNQNGTYETSEIIAEGSTTAGTGIDASGTSAYTFTVPSGLSSGTYSLRVRLAYYTADIDPCTQYTYGETEDYQVEIGGSCAAPADTTIVVANITSTSANISWANTSPANGYNYTVYHLPDSSIVTSGNTADTFLNVTTLNPNDTFVVKLISVCDSTNGAFSDPAMSPVFATLCDTPVLTLASTAVMCNGNSVTLHTGNTDPNTTTLWSDGSTAEGLIVNTVGTYSVTVTDQYACTATASSVVTASVTPQVNGIIATQGANNTYNFSASGAQNVGSYSWNFGDGNTSTDATPSNTYTQSGDFTVTLIVSNECGSDTATTIIHIAGNGVNQIGLDNKLMLYPNPAKDMITLKNESSYTMQSVVVSNVLGQVIYQAKTNNAKEYQLDVHSYASGTYSVKIMLTDGSWVVRKFEILK